jgi:hypothetical protein
VFPDFWESILSRRDISESGRDPVEGEQACPEDSQRKGEAAPLERAGGRNYPPDHNLIYEEQVLILNRHSMGPCSKPNER